MIWLHLRMMPMTAMTPSQIIALVVSLCLEYQFFILSNILQKWRIFVKIAKF